MTIEISMRWGDTLLDVTHIETGDFTLAGVPLVYAGTLVAAPVGRVGHVEYTATPITRPRRSVPFARHGDRRCWPYIAGALAVHVALWGVATTEHPPPENAPAPTTDHRPLKVTRVAAAAAKTYVPPDDRARDRVADTKSQGQAAAMLGPSGAAGARSPIERGHVAVKNTGEPAQLSKAEAVERARHAGILGSTQVLLESYVNLGGSEKLTSAFDAIHVTAPHAGGEGTAGGSFGLGVSGAGTGGGGSAYGTIGSGRTGTYSNGTTHGHGWGGSRAPRTSASQWDTWNGGRYYYGGYPGRIRSHVQTVTICPQGFSPCVVEGDLDKAIVRRYVKRNIQKLTYCYEKELLGRPELSGGGLVHLGFAISDGRVHVSRSQGFDATVAFCTRTVLEAIELPKGDAIVEYVLRFQGPT